LETIKPVTALARLILMVLTQLAHVRNSTAALEILEGDCGLMAAN